MGGRCTVMARHPTLTAVRRAAQLRRVSSRTGELAARFSSADHGRGGDIEDPHDAIQAAARHLRRAGAAHDLEAALFAYNHSRPYVRAIRRFAHPMRTDAQVFTTYYAWQVYAGGRRLTGPTGRRAATASELRGSTRR